MKNIVASRKTLLELSTCFFNGYDYEQIVYYPIGTDIASITAHFDMDAILNVVITVLSFEF